MKDSFYKCFFFFLFCLKSTNTRKRLSRGHMLQEQYLSWRTSSGCDIKGVVAGTACKSSGHNTTLKTDFISPCFGKQGWRNGESTRSDKMF